MNIKFVVVAFLFSIASKAQFTSIPDINFENVLIAQGLDNGSPDGKVLTSNINTLKNLNISNENNASGMISNLTGIEDFIALENLNCSHNNLKSVDFSKNIALTTLSCFRNQLTTINIAANTNLTTLDCSSNFITDLNILNNTLIKSLNANFNELKNLDLSNNISLEIIKLKFNKLEIVNLFNNTNLQEIDCSNNLLTELNLSKNSKLVSVNCSNQNSLININLQNGNNLNLIYTGTDKKSDFTNCRNLTCITVDDVDYSNTNWGALKNFTSAVYTSFSSPSPEIKSPQTLCSSRNPTIGDIIIPSGISLNWYLFSALGSSLPSNTPLENGKTYYASQNSGGCNSARTAVKIIIQSDNKTPPAADANQTFCLGQNKEVADIVVNRSNQIIWYDAPTNGRSISEATLLVNGTTYYATQTINGCESDRAAVKITLDDKTPPIPDKLVLDPIIGDCHTVVKDYPTATDNCGGKITATTTSSLTFNTAGEYTITWNYRDRSNNTTPQTQKVTINAVPVPIITNPGILCEQQNATLSDIQITGENPKWYQTLNGTIKYGGDHILVNNVIYYATQTIDGCESKRVPFEAKILNTHPVTGDKEQSFCSDTNPTLASIIATGNAIKWYDKNNTIIPITTPLSNEATYFGTQTVSGCESQTKLEVKTNIISALITNDYVVNLCDESSDKLETVDLSKYNKNLTSDITDKFTFKYYNSKDGAEKESSTDEITTFENHSIFFGENKIYVLIKSSSVCTAVVTLTLNLFALPELTIPSIIPICSNKSVLISTGNDNDSYDWSNDDFDGSFFMKTNVPGDYWVKVEKSYGTLSCPNEAKFKLVSSSEAKIIVKDSSQWTDVNNSIIVEAVGTGKYVYSLDGEVFQESNQFFNLTSGKKNLFVKDLNGCNTVIKEIPILMYQRFFTPNGDGFNDTWHIENLDFENQKSVFIYNRNGQLVKNLTNKNDFWDGKLNDLPLPTDDYWFLIKSPGQEDRKGHFTLKR